jgi:tetratricopeptide (TPR) repeat protein
MAGLVSLFRSKKYQEAFSIIERIEEDYKSHLHFYFYNAYYFTECFYKLNRPHAVIISYLDHLIELLPKYYFPYEEKAVYLVRIGQGREALSCYDQMKLSIPNQPYPYEGKATLLKQLEKYEEAIICYERIVSFNISLSHNILFYEQIIACYQRLGKDEVAIACFDRIIALDPKKVSSYEKKWNYLNDATRAIICFRKMIVYDETIIGHLHFDSRLQWLERRGKFDELLGLFNHLILHYPDYLTVYEAKIQYISQSKLILDHEKETFVLVCFDQMIKLFPNKQYAYMRKAQYLDHTVRVYNNPTRSLEAVICYDELIDLSSETYLCMRGKLNIFIN